MERLLVFYDGRCALCQRIKAMLESEACFVPLVFKDRHAEHYADAVCEQLDRHQSDLLVLSDDGAVYVGTQAYIMVLWATKRYRSLSLKMGSPHMQPLVKKMCDWLTHNRHRMSSWRWLVGTTAEERAVAHAKLSKKQPCGQYECMV